MVTLCLQVHEVFLFKFMWVWIKRELLLSDVLHFEEWVVVVFWCSCFIVVVNDSYVIMNFDGWCLKVIKVLVDLKVMLKVEVNVKNEGLEKVKIALCPPLLFFDFLLAKWPLFDVFDDFNVMWDFLVYWCYWIYESIPSLLSYVSTINPCLIKSCW